MKPLSYKTVADIRLRGLTCWEVVERYRDTEYHDVVFGAEKNLSRRNDEAHILFGYTGGKRKHILGAFVKRYEKGKQAGWHYRYRLSSFGMATRFETGDFGFYPWNYESNVIEALLLAGVWRRIGMLDGRFDPNVKDQAADRIDEPDESVSRIGDQPACWLSGSRKDRLVLFVDKHVKDSYAVFSVEKKALEQGHPVRKLFSDTELRPQSLSPYMQILLNDYAEEHSLSRYVGRTFKQILGSLKKGKGPCKPNPFQHVLRG